MGQLEKNTAEQKQKARLAAKKKAQEDGWRGFVNVELTANQKAEAKRMLTDLPRVWDNVFGLVEEGYKMTLSYDEQRTAFNMSFTCKRRGDANQGLTLSGRGGSVEAAAVSFWYKHYVVLQMAWGEASTGTGEGFAADEFD